MLVLLPSLPSFSNVGAYPAHDRGSVAVVVVVLANSLFSSAMVHREQANELSHYNETKWPKPHNPKKGGGEPPPAKGWTRAMSCLYVCRWV
jgi:hypothetical protein